MQVCSPTIECLVFLQSFRQPSRNVSLHALWKCNGPTNTRICFWCLPHSRCLHRTRPLILGTLSAPNNQDVLLRCVWLPCLANTIRRTSSRLFRCVMFAFSPMPFSPSATCICWTTHFLMTGWVCQWKPFKKAYIEGWVFQIFFCENPFSLLRDPLVILERRTPVELCTCYISGD